MKSITEVRNKLVEISERLENGKLDIKKAKELHAGIGKILSTVKSQLDYSKARKEKPNIGFMK
jgi:hypothetical protein